MKSEFSRPYGVERLPPEGLRFAITARPEERALLVKRFELVSLDRLEAAGELSPGPAAATFEVRGTLHAVLSQSCVVTMEPVPAELDVPFERRFTREPPDDEVEIDAEAEPPEPLDGPVLDLGELVAEELAVALDPYPRAPDADAVLAELAPPDDEEGQDAWAALAALRRN